MEGYNVRWYQSESGLSVYENMVMEIKYFFYIKYVEKSGPLDFNVMQLQDNRTFRKNIRREIYEYQETQTSSWNIYISISLLHVLTTQNTFNLYSHCPQILKSNKNICLFLTLFDDSARTSEGDGIGQSE
jgi:hypothetical protein